MAAGSGGDATESNDREEGSLAWGWLGSVAVVALTVLVLVAAVLRTPGAPDCEGYSAAGWLLFCPWVRAFLANVVLLLGGIAGVVTVGGLLVGVVRLAVRRARRRTGR